MKYIAVIHNYPFHMKLKKLNSFAPQLNVAKLV